MTSTLNSQERQPTSRLESPGPLPTRRIPSAQFLLLEFGRSTPLKRVDHTFVSNPITDPVVSPYVDQNVNSAIEEPFEVKLGL